jgi:hypothetical protein
LVLVVVVVVVVMVIVRFLEYLFPYFPQRQWRKKIIINVLYIKVGIWRFWLVLVKPQ